jgi:hypothetical protein
MVEDHNEAVKELESYLVKYLKGGQMAAKRPILKKGAFLGMGGDKKVCGQLISTEKDSKLNYRTPLITSHNKSSSSGTRLTTSAGLSIPC